MLSRKFVILVLVLLPSFGFAHGPTPQKAKESIEIKVPLEITWAAVKQFDKISEWHGDLRGSTGDGRLESGGIRTLTFQNGEQLSDELDFFSDKDHEYSFRIKTENTKALPVSSYSVTVQVEPGSADQSSIITFKSRFYRGDTGNTPSETLNDEAAVNAMTTYFKNGLAGLKRKLEQ